MCDCVPAPGAPSRPRLCENTPFRLHSKHIYLYVSDRILCFRTTLVDWAHWGHISIRRRVHRATKSGMEWRVASELSWFNINCFSVLWPFVLNQLSSEATASSVKLGLANRVQARCWSRQIEFEKPCSLLHPSIRVSECLISL